MAVGYSPDGKTVAAGGLDGRVRLWNAETGDEVGTLSTGWAVMSLCFSRDGETLAAACFGKVVVLWRRDGRYQVVYD